MNSILLSDRRLSKFDLETNDKKVSLKSSIFPDKKGVGHISLADFSLLVESSFGEPMHKLVIDKYVDKGVRARKFRKRQPASVSKEETPNEDLRRWFGIWEKTRSEQHFGIRLKEFSKERLERAF